MSCGPYHGDGDTHIVCFDPYVLPDSLYRFFTDVVMSGYAGMRQSDIPSRKDSTLSASPDFDQNIREWGEYFNNQVPLSDIKEFVYADDSESLQQILDTLRKGNVAEPPLAMCGGRTARQIILRGDTTMLRYMIFAKNCEQSIAFDPASGNICPSVLDRQLLPRGRAELALCQNPVIRLRYGYQLVRLAHYSGRPDEAIGIYDSIIAPNPSLSVIRYYAMLQQAAIREDYAESLYYLSLVFDKDDEHKKTALVDFRIDSESTWRRTFTMARSNHERSVLWMLRGITEYSLSTIPMEEMVRFEPRNPMLDVMLMREVREVERRLYSERATRPSKIHHVPSMLNSVQIESQGSDVAACWTDSTDDQRYPTRLARFVERCASRHLVDDPSLWYAVAGYMRIIDGELADANRDLDRARESRQGNPRLALQVGALRVLARTSSEQYLPTDMASRYTDALTWIKGYQNDVRPYVPVIGLLGRNYLRQGDVARAVGAFGASGNIQAMSAVLDMYASDGDLLRLQCMLERPRRQAIDTMLFNEFPLSAGEILGVRAVHMLRAGRFAEAVRLWGEVERRKPRQTTLADTLSAESIEGYESFSAGIDTLLPAERPVGWKGSRQIYTSASFARTMLSLDNLARRDRRNAGRYNYAIAGALLSTPYWGYSKRIWNGGMIDALRNFVRPTEYPFNLPSIADRMFLSQLSFFEEYGSNRLTRRYLDRARRATHDPEFAARCLVDMDQAAMHPQTSFQGQPELVYQDRTIYNILRTRYRETNSAEQALSSCDNYKWFTLHP